MVIIAEVARLAAPGSPMPAKKAAQTTQQSGPVGDALKKP
jgi:hypothetical protein